MSTNHDEAYWKKAFLEPVAPITLWLYPPLKRVKGSSQRAVLADTMRRAAFPRLKKWLGYVWLLVLAAKIWTRESGHFEVARILENALLAVLLLFGSLMLIQDLRTRRILSREIPASSPSDASG